MKNIKPFNSYLNENESFNIDSKIDGVTPMEESTAKSWKFYPTAPLTIKSITGEIKEDLGYLVVELSNSDKLNFSAFWPQGQQSQNTTATLIINGSKKDVSKEFVKNVKKYNSVVEAVMKTYEQIQYSDEALGI